MVDLKEREELIFFSFNHLCLSISSIAHSFSFVSVIWNLLETLQTERER